MAGRKFHSDMMIWIIMMIWKLFCKFSSKNAINSHIRAFLATNLDTKKCWGKLPSCPLPPLKKTWHKLGVACFP